MNPIRLQPQREDEFLMKHEEPKDQQSMPDPEHATPPYPTGDPPDDPSVLYQDHNTSPPVPTPESGAQSESEEPRTKSLLAAYQQTFEVVEDLPAVVWVRWRGKGLRRYLKFPYLRWFLRYFLIHHIYRNLTILNRRLHVLAAMNSDHDVNKWDREAVGLYLRGLPPPPYKRFAFAIFFAALLLALPLRSLGVGDVTPVLDLVGSIMKVDIGGVAKAFTVKEFGETVRAMLVLILTSSILAFFLTSPFVLKRMLFNLYPATKERLSHTAAREQAFSVRGIYAIEDRVFNEVGLRRPKEAPFDLLARVFVLLVLLLLSVLLGLLTLLAALAAASAKEFALEGSGWYINVAVDTYWDAIIFLALPAIIFFIAFVACFRLLLKAWRRRNLPRSE
jgi:hypothetical protein